MFDDGLLCALRLADIRANQLATITRIGTKTIKHVHVFELDAIWQQAAVRTSGEELFDDNPGFQSFSEVLGIGVGVSQCEDLFICTRLHGP